jgi:hypothetical protein
VSITHSIMATCPHSSGQQYAQVGSEVRTADEDANIAIRNVTRDLQIDRNLVRSFSDVLVDFKGTGPAGKARVVPGRTIGK